MSKAAPLPVVGLSAAAMRALADLDAAPVPYDTAEFLHGMAPLAELKAAGRAFCDCRRGGEFTEWKATNWWIANNDRARGGARVLNAVAMVAHRKYPHIEHADFQQEAVLLVPGLVPSYVAGRVPFGAYVPRAIRRALFRWADSQPVPSVATVEEGAAVLPVSGLEGVDVWGRVASVVTEQQFAALALVGDGMRVADIARELGLSVRAAQSLIAAAYHAIRSSGVLSEFEPGEGE